MSECAAIEIPQVHLLAGQIFLTPEPSRVTTVLGSCVAVTMFDPQSPLAAICHVMLAAPRPTEIMLPTDPRRFRYATQAIPAMIAAFEKARVRPSAVEVKLFGGANLIGHDKGRDPHWIGGANIAAARRLLEAAGFSVRAENTGGGRGRKILFDTGTGEVLHKYLRTPRS